jgi:glutamate-ammonia-ligase adenylyltransferase
MPVSALEKRRLARAARIQPPDADQLEKTWRSLRREVRSLHEELYYRPLLPATAKLSVGEVTLAPEAAWSRLAALGYRNPEGALRHINALTSGVSRRSAIQRQLLPVMLGWFAEGADPDAGLLAFRRLSEALGGAPWFLRMLRDSSGAAERLAHVLAASAYVAESLSRSPQSSHWFGGEAELRPRAGSELRSELLAIVNRQPGQAEAATAVRALRRRELTRLATGMALGWLDDGEARFAVSTVAGVALEAALELAWDGLESDDRLVDLAVIAMGSLGGREMAINSDADVLFVHRPRPGVSRALAGAQAIHVATKLRTLLSDIGPEPSLEVDPDLRPEGRAGELSRSLEAYRQYYGRWALTWELQALLRARPVAGDPVLAAEFMSMADKIRYPANGLSAAQLKDLRLMKARIEAERLPRGVEPLRHLKLGPGGLLDVQWVAQLYQLRHAHQVPSLRVTGTVEVLEAAASSQLMAKADSEALIRAWMQAMSIRNANVLSTGKVTPSSDVLPSDRRQLRGVAALMGYMQGTQNELAEDRLRLARRGRQVFERLFYG